MDLVKHRTIVLPAAPDSVGPRPTTLAVAVLLISALEYAVWCFVQGQGVTLTGDEPHYLVIAMSLTHLDPHVLWAYERVAQTHYIHLGSQLTAASTHTFAGPHGSLSVHDIGLPMLIAPFFALGGTGGALLGFDLLLAIGFVTLHQRASRLARLSNTGQWVFAILMSGPALWLASTQLYPDLIGGLFLGVAFVEIGLAERKGVLGRFGMAAITIGLGFAPWLNFKNSLPVAIGIAAFSVVATRSRLPVRRVALTGCGIAVLIAVRALYNSYYIGHLLGLPQAPPNSGSNGIASVLALAFDRHQGMFVQLPILILGLVGAAFAFRWLSTMTIGALLAAAALLVINGTYTVVIPDPTALNGQHVVNALGNLSYAGRYQWSAVPLLLAFVPFALQRLEATPRRLMTLGAGVGVLWLLQSFPLLLGDHSYLNATVDPFTAWDPTLYPGWWGVVDQVVPTYYGFGRSLALMATWFQTGAEVLGLSLFSFLVVALSRGSRVRIRKLATTGVGLAAVLLAATLFGPRQTIPFGPYLAPLPSAGIVGMSDADPTAVPVTTVRDVGPGKFRVGIGFTTLGAPASTSALFAVTATALPHNGSLVQLPDARTGSTSEPVIVGTLHLPGGTASGIASITVRIPVSSTLSVQATIGPQGRLTIQSLRLTKLS